MIDEADNKRVLGIDYGAKNVGVALSDEAREFALPLAVISNTSDLLNEIIKIAADNKTREIVIGESRNYKGEPNPIFHKAEKLKKELEARGFTVHGELEFMTSVQAERLQGKHDKIDASAAALILRFFLDKKKVSAS
jgi:putative Holliday junction resolvase